MRLLRGDDQTGNGMAFFHADPNNPDGDLITLLRDFLHDCASSPVLEEPLRLRQAFLLLTGTDLCAATEDRDAFEAMLTVGAHESAALMLIGPDAPFMMSRGPNGRCLASLFGASAEEEIVAEGASLTLALLVAYASALIARLEGDGNPKGKVGTSAWARLH